MIDLGGAAAEKQRLRGEMKRLLAAAEAGVFRDSGAAVSRRLAALPEWRAAAAVCAFLSMNGEIGTEEICRAALAEGKALCLPRTEPEDLSFRVCPDLSGPWDEGPFGIREPAPSAPVVDFAAMPGPVLVVVPGLAFDRGGGRLGRGKGYYDRFLRSLRSLRRDVHAVGIALGFQLVEAVPVSASDERVDLVLTD